MYLAYEKETLQPSDLIRMKNSYFSNLSRCSLRIHAMAPVWQNFAKQMQQPHAFFSNVIFSSLSLKSGPGGTVVISFYSSQGFGSVLVSNCYNYILPKCYWLKTICLYHLTILEIRCPKSVSLANLKLFTTLCSFWRLQGRTCFLACSSF